MMEREGTIYAFIDPITTNIRYIGQTIVTLSDRLKKHFYDADRHNNHVNLWVRSLKRNGIRPIIEAIGVYPFSELDEMEIYFIEKYRRDGYDLTNTSPGGQAKKIFSEETKNKISNTLTGRKQSQETRAKRSASSTKTWSSPELKKLKSEQGKRLWDRLRKERTDICKWFNVFCISSKYRNGLKTVVVKGNLVFSSNNLTETCDKLKLNRPNVRMCLQKKRNYVGNYYFEYI